MGDVRRVRIAQVMPARFTEAKTIAVQAQARRDTVLTKAHADAERANAEMFAASLAANGATTIWPTSKKYHSRKLIYAFEPPGQHKKNRI